MRKPCCDSISIRALILSSLTPVELHEGFLALICYPKNQFMRGTVLLCTCLLMWVTMFAQNRTVSGKITDVKDGSPLSGVTVKAKGQTNVVLSQQDGSFTITVPAGTKSLEFSYVGYADVEMPVSDNMN